MSGTATGDTSKAGKASCISVSDRIESFENVSTKFRNHLFNVSGVALPAALRWLVVLYAQEAMMCTACPTELPPSACIKPGTDVFACIQAMNHDEKTTTAKALCEANNVAERVQKVLATIVHSIVNHQRRLDEAWYSTAVRTIEKTEGILPANENEESDNDNNKDTTENLAYAAFAEILMLTVISHAMAVAFLVMDRPLASPVPTAEEAKQTPAARIGPTLIDWTDLLKGPLRYNNKICHARYILSRDVNKRSVEFKRISQEAWRAMQSFMDTMDPKLPAALAVEDAAMFVALQEVYFVPKKDMMALYKTELDPSIRCADAFSRYDAEFVASKVAEAYHCGF